MAVLDRKVAVVTGGSRGIGRAVVERLARDGAAVVLSYLHNKDLANQVIARVKADGGQAHAVQAELSKLTDIQHLFDETEMIFGGIDILVNNAGQVSTTTIGETTEHCYDRLMAINAKGTFFAMQQAARRLRDGGRIINVSSLNTVHPEHEVAVYAASKAAVEQFTAIGALELADRQITVNTVSPGATDTDLLRSSNPAGALDMVVTTTPLGRLGQPADIADVIAFLAGPDARWLTGQNLRVTGGLA